MAEESLFTRFANEKWAVVDELIAEKWSETLILEFKRKSYKGDPGKLHDDDKKNLAKTISAFANTEGGCLIFGIATDDGKGVRADRADEVQSIPNLSQFTHQVDSILRDITIPSVPRICLQPVKNPGKSDEGILAIHVRQSIGRPHQAGSAAPDGVRDRYYQRSASHSDIMPHSLIAALMGRVPSANLYLVLKLWTDMSGAKQPRFSLELGNSGRGSARQPPIRVFEPEENLSFWTEAFTNHLPGDWRTKHTITSNRSSASVFLSSNPETIVYPGDRVDLIEQESAILPYAAQWRQSVKLALRGIIYAADAAPVEFNQIVLVEEVTDTPASFNLPPPEE